MMINKITPKVNWSITPHVIPHSEVRNKPERGIGETQGAATLNGS